MTFRNSTMLMNVFLYGMINESDLFSFFFSENSSKRVQYKICRKHGDITNTFYFLEPP